MPLSGQQAAVEFSEWVGGIPILGAVIGSPVMGALLVTAMALIVMMATYWYEPVGERGWRTRARVGIYTALLVGVVMFVQHQGIVASCAREIRGGGAHQTFESVLGQGRSANVTAAPMPVPRQRSGLPEGSLTPKAKLLPEKRGSTPAVRGGGTLAGFMTGGGTRAPPDDASDGGSTSSGTSSDTSSGTSSGTSDSGSRGENLPDGVPSPSAVADIVAPPAHGGARHHTLAAPRPIAAAPQPVAWYGGRDWRSATQPLSMPAAVAL